MAVIAFILAAPCLGLAVIFLIAVAYKMYTTGAEAFLQPRWGNFAVAASAGLFFLLAGIFLRQSDHPPKV